MPSTRYRHRSSDTDDCAVCKYDTQTRMKSCSIWRTSSAQSQLDRFAQTRTWIERRALEPARGDLRTEHVSDTAHAWALGHLGCLALGPLFGGCDLDRQLLGVVDDQWDWASGGIAPVVELLHLGLTHFALPSVPDRCPNSGPS